MASDAVTPVDETSNAGAPMRSQRPGIGFGYGWSVLTDPIAAGSPQGQGTIQWGGAYGHSWFVDAANELSAVALSNTAFEGTNGVFPQKIRNAVYG
jgi:CubicO group peptidase (beta-lactamase class C family)